MAAPWLLILMCCISITVIGGMNLVMEPSTRIHEGKTVTIACTLKNHEGPLLWERYITGDVWVTLGNDITLSEPFNKVDRYHISHHGFGQGNQDRTYTFTIKALRFDDTGLYRCKIHNTAISKMTALAVCDNPDDETCKCIEKTGFNAPRCFGDTTEELHSNYRKTITGLIVCLVVAVLIGIGFAALAGYDCMRKMAQKGKQAAHEAPRHAANAVRRQRGPYDESERMGLEPNDTASLPSREGVHSNPAFSDEAPPYSEVMPQPHQNGYGPGSGKATPNDKPRQMGRSGGAIGKTATPVGGSYGNAGIPQTGNYAEFDHEPRGARALPYTDEPQPQPSPYNNHAAPSFNYPSARPTKSPGDFSLHSGDLDILRTPGTDASPSPRLAEYNDQRNHYTEPRRLDFVNPPNPPPMHSIPPDNFTPGYKGSTMI